MAIEIIDIAAVAEAATAHQRDVFARTGGAAMHRLVGITENPGAVDIRSYSRAIDGQAAKVDPDHQRDSSHDEATYRLYIAKDARDARREAERMAGVTGVGVLPFRRFADESRAHEVLGAIPHEQDVDGQRGGRLHWAATATTSLRIAGHALLERGDSLRDKKVAILGRGAAVGGPAEEILANAGEEDRPAEVTIITEKSNSDIIKDRRLGEYDVIILGARAPDRSTVEMVTPDHIRRARGDDRDPIILVDAAYDTSPKDGTPRGNLHRAFESGQVEDVDAAVTPFGAVGRLTKLQIMDNTIAVAGLQAAALAEARK
jgi:5,10-methylene-tetrahydrofolate dehydrogenase/methenyl tetrahydrofolate cyclohydrolase